MQHMHVSGIESYMENRKMTYEYDVVVVGAGNGGLTAASRLAQEGLRVVLLERHNLPGGCAASFVRGRFEFEASLHELCGVGTPEKPGAVRRLFTQLGADAGFINEKNLFRAITVGEDGFDVTLKSGGEEFYRSVTEACPGSEKAVRKLRKLMDDTEKALEYNDASKGSPSKLVMLLKYSKFLLSASHSIDDILRSLGFTLKERHILETYWSYLGVPADELNAFHYLEMLRGYINGGAGVPYHKSYGLSLSLADVFLKNGGEIRYNTEVTGLIFENGRVAGVTAGADEYRAKEVVSNVIPHNVFGMKGRENIPLREKRLLNARKLGISFICIYLGLDATAEELGIKDYSLFVAHMASSRNQYLAEHAKGMYVVNCLNVAVPDATPEGTCSLFFTVPIFTEKLIRGFDSGNYREMKSEVAELYIEDYERVTGIRIKDRIEEISVATPVTFARYFGSPNGTAYGYELSKWDSLMARNLSQESELNIAGLTFCGGHSVRGDGYGVSYESGMSAAEAVIKRMKGSRDGQKD